MIDTYCYTNSPHEVPGLCIPIYKLKRNRSPLPPCPPLSAAEFQRCPMCWPPSNKPDPILSPPPAPARGLLASRSSKPSVLLSPSVLWEPRSLAHSKETVIPGNPLLAPTSLPTTSVYGCSTAAGNHKAWMNVCPYFGADFCQECTKHFIN